MLPARPRFDLRYGDHEEPAPRRGGDARNRRQDCQALPPQVIRDLCSATPETAGEIVRKNVLSGKESFLDFDGSTDPDFRPDTALDVILSVMDGKAATA